MAVPAFQQQYDRATWESLAMGSDPRFDKYKNKVINQSFLRKTLPIVNGQSNYVFNFQQQNAGSVPLPDQLLTIQDSFVITSLALFLRKTVTVGGVIQYGEFEDCTFENPTYFPAVAGFNPQHLQVFYKGTLGLTINQIIMLNTLSTQRFRYVPQTQQSAINAKSMVEFGDASMYPIPTILLEGQNSSQFTLTVPMWNGFQGASATAGTEYQVSLYANGFLIPQGSGVGNS